jgi:DNA-binding NarL/FixJ family response regulator
MSLAMKVQEKKIRLVLVDSWMVYRSGFEAIIRNHPDFELVNCASFSSEARKFSELDKVHLAIIDVDLPDESAIQLGRSLIEANSNLRLLILCDRDWDIYLVMAKGIGAAGVLMRNAPADEIIASICKVMDVALYHPEQLARIKDWQQKIGRYLMTPKEA